MYSSTELIRKSKIIFNKILTKEIDKAVILRDGKPSFMLLDFNKYEKIMAEYNILKANLDTNNITNLNTHSKIKEKSKENLRVKNSIQVIPPKPMYIEPKIEKQQSIAANGIEVLDDLDFDDDFKKEVVKKIEQKKKQKIAMEKSSPKVKNNNIEKKSELKEFWA
jgi:hypothetical protein